MQINKIITITETQLPQKLTVLHQRPRELQAIGNIQLLEHRPIVGIVGSRKISNYGREVTSSISRELTTRGIPIVSGLALGVDSVAHREVVEQNGRTIAVLPTGLRNIYPASHYGLAMKIIEQDGLLISEYPEDAPGLKHQFIERNRLIAALSDVLVITEAAERSGSLHTAQFALELGITVMAVPGDITSTTSKGTNTLIQNGAAPVLSVDDILRELGIEQTSIENEYYPENEDERQLLNLLRHGIHSSHELLEKSGLKPAQFQAQLTMLEIKGVVQPRGGNWYIR
jgi:DNA processing protein